MERSQKIPITAKKRLIRKQIDLHYQSSNQKLACTQTFGSAFLNRVRKTQNSRNEYDFLKMFDCFIDCHNSVNSDYASFVRIYSTVLQCSLSSLP